MYYGADCVSTPSYAAAAAAAAAANAAQKRDENDWNYLDDEQKIRIARRHSLRGYCFNQCKIVVSRPNNVVRLLDTINLFPF